MNCNVTYLTRRTGSCLNLWTVQGQLTDGWMDGWTAQQSGGGGGKPEGEPKYNIAGGKINLAKLSCNI